MSYKIRFITTVLLVLLILTLGQCISQYKEEEINVSQDCYDYDKQMCLVECRNNSDNHTCQEGVYDGV